MGLKGFGIMSNLQFKASIVIAFTLLGAVQPAECAMDSQSQVNRVIITLFALTSFESFKVQWYAPIPYSLFRSRL